MANSEKLRKIVVVMDICSSTAILEELKRTDNLEKWEEFLTNLQGGLEALREFLRMEIYKFIGDGWILLLPPDTKLDTLLEFLDIASSYFAVAYEEVDKLLQQRIKGVGLSFGVDLGDLSRFEMNGQTEYIGRAINIASRLQSALPKDRANKVLCSRNCLHSLPLEEATTVQDDKIIFKTPDNPRPLTNLTVQLKNVANGKQYECIAWDTLTKYKPDSEAVIAMVIFALIVYGFSQSAKKGEKPPPET